MWRALDVFTKGHRSKSAEVPKNLTANAFNNHFLSVLESLIEPRTNVYEYSNLLHDFSVMPICIYLIPVILYLLTSSLAGTKLLNRFLTEPKLQSLSNKVFEFEFSNSFCCCCHNRPYVTASRCTRNFCLKELSERQDLIIRGRLFHRKTPKKAAILILYMSILGPGKLR